MNKVARRILLVLILISGMQFYATAQFPPGEPDPDAVPLDPGSWILVAAGVGYGVKKWKDSKQKPGEETSDKF